jgi:hypothetical protein
MRAAVSADNLRDESELRSYHWACDTRGALTPEQRRGLLPKIARSYGAFFAGTASLPWRRRRAPEPPPAVVPHSKLTQIADEAAREQPAPIAEHGYRTWLFGTALAHVDAMQLDPELFYIGALLHDVGIVKAVAGEDFTIRSAERALATLDTAEQDPNPERRTSLADAIVAHTSPGLTAGNNPMGLYIQAGAILDLLGMRLWDLPQPFVRDVYARHPQAGVRAMVRDMVKNEARAVPAGRFALLAATGFRFAVSIATTRNY